MCLAYLYSWSLHALDSLVCFRQKQKSQSSLIKVPSLSDWAFRSCIHEQNLFQSPCWAPWWEECRAWTRVRSISWWTVPSPSPQTCAASWARHQECTAILSWQAWTPRVCLLQEELASKDGAEIVFKSWLYFIMLYFYFHVFNSTQIFGWMDDIRLPECQRLASGHQALRESAEQPHFSTPSCDGGHA